MASYTKPDPPKDDETYTRKNAWNNGGTFSNPDLEWYAKGVGEMMSRSLDDPNSWWFFAAIHGEYITGETSYPGWGFIPGPPQVPTTPVPSQSVQDQYWDQCQHQSWYFPPWHRGYLLALEAQIREAIVSLGGPSTWALPYWNYFGPSNQYEIPPAFTQQTLPDGTTPNPLFVEQRFGPNNDGNIFIPIPPVSEACENNTIYTGSNSATRPPGFGGPQTGFAHGGGVSGNLESNPHNQVHVYVGGNSPDGQTWGLMSDPGIAALDPIFYLHHSNIDRMWAAWNANGNPNTTDPNWLGGPASTGGREFVMPMPGATPWVYTPDMVKSLSQLDYVYDDLTVAVSAQPSSVLAQRLNKLGAPAPSGLESVSGDDMDSADNAELVGANSGPLEIKSSGARANVKLDPDVRGKVSDSLEATTDTLPDRVYLQLENVRGTRDAYRLTVSVNQKRAGSVALFGLRRASLKDGEHGGEGLTYVLDITDIIDDLFLENSALDLNSLDVRIVPNQAVADEADLSIGRISVYRQGQE
jgi:tyrosinase